jgi:hypothetical protein
MACSICEGTTVRTRATLTWAIPVHIEQLGPHLEAYIQVKPILHQIRLCHRFGRGHGTYLHMLPHELSEMVIDNVLQNHRAKFAPFQKWRKPFLCYQQLCENTKHYDDEHVQDLRDEMLENLLHCGFIDYEDPRMEEIVEQEVQTAYAEGDSFDRHLDQRIKGKEMVEQKLSGHLCTTHSTQTITSIGLLKC